MNENNRKDHEKCFEKAEALWEGVWRIEDKLLIYEYTASPYDLKTPDEFRCLEINYCPICGEKL